MRGLVLGNESYKLHMTDEGFQLQESLKFAGWTLDGPGYSGEHSAKTLVKTHKPHHVFVQDKRDWDPLSECPGATAETAFTHISSLSALSNVTVSCVVKDAGPEGSEYHEQFCKEIGADAVVHYYHPLSILKYSPWLQHYKLVRTYHSINPVDVPPFVAGTSRRPIVGSGAIGSLTTDVYPLRSRVAPRAQEFGMVWLTHPGYNNDRGPDTPNYLRFLSQFKVSLATSSAYGFSLRKIIESVACGCTVVTDLPSYDILPEIDRAIVRIKPTITDTELKVVLKEAVSTWEEEGRRRWAQKAVAYYNYHNMGQRLSDALFKV